MKEKEYRRGQKWDKEKKRGRKNARKRRLT